MYNSYFLSDWLKPPVQKNQHPLKDQERAYEFYRARVFFGIFLGYAGYYLVRKNICLIMPELEKTYGYSKFEQGLLLSAISLAYGISKFIMGSISDRSNAQAFLAIGLFLSGVISVTLGIFPGLFAYFEILFALMFINGWVQGMGWPPCGRVMVHWFSARERGSKMAVWNMAHNLGQALPAFFISLGAISYYGWTSVLYFPGILAIIISIITIYLVQDTPAAVGLPAIEIYKKEETSSYDKEDPELSVSEQLTRYIFTNKNLWFLAIANLFVYLTRYAIIDWLPSYLTEVRGYTTQKAGLIYWLYEISGLLGTFLCGWISDKLFDGRRAPAGVLFMSLVAIVLCVYWFAPNEQTLLIDSCLILLGFLIYGPVMLIGVHALDLVPKFIAGTAAGFTGLFGYVGGATCANALFGWVVDRFGWDGGFVLLFGSCLAAIFFISLTWNVGSMHRPIITPRTRMVSDSNPIAT